MDERKRPPAMLFYGTILIAVGATVMYHLVQKGIPPTAHPLLTMALVYAVAMLLCLALIPLFPLRLGLADSLRQVNWATFALAVAVTGIEVGFLLAYRAGWPISLGGLVVNIAATSLLIPLGILLFRDRLSLTQVLGLLLCVVGLVLVNRR
ncbi:MAG: hypothetical protein H0T53_09580 [Herpetosiphonaceae bacterium]|nr:hypothetical protein [Herpetosiphonaceae bacterium]